MEYLPFQIEMSFPKRLLPPAPVNCNLAFLSGTHAGATFQINKCSGSYTFTFPTVTYNTASCAAPLFDPDWYSPYGSYTQQDWSVWPCTTGPCTFEMNNVQTAVVTDGLTAVIDTCSSQLVAGYKYRIDICRYTAKDKKEICDTMYFIINSVVIPDCLWTAITTTSSMAKLKYGNGQPLTTFPFDTILTQTPACGYSIFSYQVRMQDLTSLSAYGITVTTTPELAIQTTQAVSTLPKILQLQWMATTTQYTTGSTTPWTEIYINFSLTIYCTITSLTQTPVYLTTYTVHVGASLVLGYPATTQSPACDYTVQNSYSVGGVENAVLPWLTTSTQFVFAPTLASEAGTYDFVYYSTATDDGGLETVVSSSFTVLIQCALTSLTPVTTLQSSYSVIVSSVLSITLPTYTQVPACGLTPVVTYSVDGVTSATAAWLATSTTVFTITPTLAAQQGSYAFIVNQAYTDGSGVVTTMSNSFNVVISSCNLATYSTPTMPDLELNYQGSAVLYEWDSFTDSISTTSGVANSCGVWSYTWSPNEVLQFATDITATQIDSNVINFEWDTRQVIDYVLNQPYTSTINGYLNGILVTSADFSVIFTCEITQMSRFNSTETSLQYLISSSSITLPLSSYAQTPNCGYALTQWYSIDGLINESVNWFIYDSTAIMIQTDDVADVGTYTLDILVTYSNLAFQFNDKQTVQITIAPSNTPPYFIDQVITSFWIVIGAPWEYSLPDYKDDEGDSVSVICDRGKAIEFLSFENNKLFVLQGVTNEAQLNQNYTAYVSLTDSQGLSSTKNQITLSFISLVKSNSNSTSANKTKNTTNQELQGIAFAGYNFTPSVPGMIVKTPVLSIKSISHSGFVTIVFSDVLVNSSASYIQNATTVIEGNPVPVFQVSIIPGYSTDRAKIGFKYNVISFEKRQMTLQLDFEFPQVISHESSDLETLQIVINDIFYFFNAYGKTINLNNTVLLAELPQIQQRQLSAQLQKALEQLQQSSKFVIGGNIALNIFLSASLQQLWSMINTQQIIVLLPLLSIYLPQNAAMFFGFIMQIASFDLLPTDQFYNNHFDINQTEPINENFDALGFDSTFFLINMGSLIVGWLSIPILLMITLLLRCLNCFCKNFQSLQRLLAKIESQMFWNYPIRVFNESATIIYMCCLINLQHHSFETKGNSLSTSLAILFLIIGIVLPVVFAIIMTRHSERLNEPEIKQKYGEIYAGLNLNRGKKLAFQPLFFFMRRFLLAVAVSMNQILICQIFIVCLSFVVQIYILGYVRPFETPFANTLEYFNETLILIIMYCMMTFTDFEPNINTQVQVGYACCLIVALHFMGNIGIILAGGLKRLRMKIIRFKNRKNVKVRPKRRPLKARVLSASLESQSKSNNSHSGLSDNADIKSEHSAIQEIKIEESQQHKAINQKDSELQEADISFQVDIPKVSNEEKDSISLVIAEIEQNLLARDQANQEAYQDEDFNTKSSLPIFARSRYKHNQRTGVINFAANRNHQRQNTMLHPNRGNRAKQRPIMQQAGLNQMHGNGQVVNIFDFEQGLNTKQIQKPRDMRQ